MKKKTAKPLIVETTRGRKFQLFKTKMKGLGYESPHWARRTEIRKAFAGTINFAVRVQYGRDDESHYSQPAYVYGPKEVRIGCMPFEGRNFIRLKKWALGKA